MQDIRSGIGSIKELKSVLKDLEASSVMLVCDDAFPFLTIRQDVLSSYTSFVIFDQFTPNPLYEDVVKGLNLYKDKACDAILVVGGGSAIDVAKCIKIFSKLDESKSYLEQEHGASDVPLIAIPTTAGTGSESTRFAVIYHKGEKQTINHESIIPEYVFLEPGVLKTLPIYQKKCTLLDALCQAIESWWSVHSNDESKAYSKLAIELIVDHMDAYIFDNDDKAAEKIMLASNYAGRAINITQTTAPHAMSYKLTTLFNLPHGHSVAICLPHVWQYMLDNISDCIDPRGESYLFNIFSDISKAYGANSPEEAIETFKLMLKRIDINPPATVTVEEMDDLIRSVNLTRLKNSPVVLDGNAVSLIYNNVFS